MAQAHGLPPALWLPEEWLHQAIWPQLLRLQAQCRQVRAPPLPQSALRPRVVHLV